LTSLLSLPLSSFSFLPLVTRAVQLITHAPTPHNTPHRGSPRLTTPHPSRRVATRRVWPVRAYRDYPRSHHHHHHFRHHLRLRLLSFHSTSFDHPVLLLPSYTIPPSPQIVIPSPISLTSPTPDISPVAMSELAQVMALLEKLDAKQERLAAQVSWRTASRSRCPSSPVMALCSPGVSPRFERSVRLRCHSRASTLHTLAL
jgi:hypothetical protein